jgi:hypothetical protein
MTAQAKKSGKPLNGTYKTYGSAVEGVSGGLLYVL